MCQCTDVGPPHVRLTIAARGNVTCILRRGTIIDTGMSVGHSISISIESPTLPPLTAFPEPLPLHTSPIPTCPCPCPFLLSSAQLGSIKPKHRQSLLLCPVLSDRERRCPFPFAGGVIGSGDSISVLVLSVNSVRLAPGALAKVDALYLCATS